MVNENIVYDFALWGNITYTNGGYYYFILDQPTIDYLKTHRLDWTDSFERTFKTLSHQDMTHTVGPFPTIEKDLQDAINEGAAVKEQTLAQIANTLNFDYNTMQQTVLEYNQIINSGFDSDFNKSEEFLQFPVSQGPFYAVQAQSTTLGTIGGITVDEALHVLDKSGQIIPNLYATGNNASGMYDTSYPTLEGISCAFAWNSGRIAGEDAAKSL
ncbi:FAD-binding protein [Lactiplantibacillus pentosus]|uniref:FAD-binding protein n=1 Tax=Lactiplantibacillus pentosus TaxID=1589 RepID=UPI002A6A5D82|nr:FAD-binding protein [Lactiplantibacillus pentosus]MDY1546234.1 FAD-binding protein [Lactiplantibacillus pentosus]